MVGLARVERRFSLIEFKISANRIRFGLVRFDVNNPVVEFEQPRNGLSFFAGA